MPERAVPWDPIPHEYNRIGDVYVGELTESADPTHATTTVIVTCAPLDRLNQENAWRIFFAPPFAFRVRGMREWPGALPLTWPKEPWAVDGAHVAFWEVVESEFIVQTVGPGLRDQAHHYVLMNLDVAYEFVARSVRVEDLGLVTG